MKVILKTTIRKLGNIGDEVEVKDGYARNFLIPNQKAVQATKENIAFFDSKKQDIKFEIEQNIKNAKEKLQKIQNLKKIHITSKSGKNGKLFGSIGKKQISQTIKKYGIQVTQKEITLKDGKTIRQIGDHIIKIRILHSELISTLMVNVLPEKKEK